MTPAQPTPQEEAAPHPALALAAALDGAFGAILRVVTLYQHFFPRIWVAAFNRISRGHQRAVRLLRAIAAGTYKTPRPSRERPTSRTPTQPAIPLPRRFNALGLLADWRFRGTAAPLAHLLSTPETQATLATLPPHARRTLGRVLRTPCRLVGAEIPAILTPAGPPRPRRARPPRPAPEPVRAGKYPRFNPYRYSPGKIPPTPGLTAKKPA